MMRRKRGKKRLRRCTTRLLSRKDIICVHAFDLILTRRSHAVRSRTFYSLTQIQRHLIWLPEITSIFKPQHAANQFQHSIPFHKTTTPSPSPPHHNATLGTSNQTSTTCVQVQTIPSSIFRHPTSPSNTSSTNFLRLSCTSARTSEKSRKSFICIRTSWWWMSVFFT